ncbi:hypothetical protein DPMN_121494 [Dreissena polymorpha]|uniref:Uncharacterized protein n=1 Tax=Dreissena polymorpha TaxID=45954 RepID=A0A9D4GQU1_DREPO|nr:hypothetical protein DPMN_121494 [Dreissena polymorpha]
MENCKCHGPPLGAIVAASVQPVRDSNPGHLAYRANALPIELTGPPHILPLIPFKFGTVTSKLFSVK